LCHTGGEYVSIAPVIRAELMRNSPDLDVVDLNHAPTFGRWSSCVNLMASRARTAWRPVDK
jgi:hypothetical protein